MFCGIFTDETTLIQQTITEFLPKAEWADWALVTGLLFSSQLKRISTEKKCLCLTDEMLKGVIVNAFSISSCKKPVEKRQDELRAQMVLVLNEMKPAAIVKLLAKKGNFGELFGELVNELSQELVLEVLKAHGEKDLLILEDIGHFNVKKAFKNMSKELKAQMSWV